MSLYSYSSSVVIVKIVIVIVNGRIIHCAGCTMGGGPRRHGAPDQLPNFYHAVLTFERAVYAVYRQA